jgi:hypothetical protein
MSNNMETIETKAATRVAAISSDGKAGGRVRAQRFGSGELPDFIFYGPALILFLAFVLLPILSSFGAALGRPR